MIGEKGGLRIGVNLLLLPRSGVVGGVETYIRNVLDAINKYDRSNKYYLFCHQSNKSIFQYSNINFQLISPNENDIIVRLIRHFQYHYNIRLWATDFDKLANSSSLDVMFYPSTIIFPPLNKHIPYVLTVADIQHEYYPEYFSSKELNDRKKHTEFSITHADRIIAVSEYTKRTILDKFHINGDKIDVVHEACHDMFSQDVQPNEMNRLKTKYRLPEKFLLYPAATWNHKNHKRLFEALGWIRDHYGFCPPLILTGIAMRNHEQIINAIKMLQLESHVLWLGYLPYEELPALYRLATLLVFPSLFEGFGIPIIEAMASGLPIVCSHVTSLPEVAGDAACYFDPINIENIGQSIYDLWHNPTLQEILRKKGYQRAQVFRANKVADQMIEVFNRVYHNVVYM